MYQVYAISVASRIRAKSLDFKPKFEKFSLQIIFARETQPFCLLQQPTVQEEENTNIAMSSRIEMPPGSKENDESQEGITGKNSSGYNLYCSQL